MTDAQPLPDPAALDPREAQAAERLATLRELREINMAVARAIGQRVLAVVAADEEIDAGMVLGLSRASREVRQIVALEARQDQDCAALAVRVKTERAEAREAAAKDRTDQMEWASGCVNEAVEELADALATRDPDDDRPERLLEAMSERLDDPRAVDDLVKLPISVQIERICASAGVTADWSLWEREDWAVAEWTERTPGSPYAPEAVWEDRAAAGGAAVPAAGYRAGGLPCHDPGAGRVFVREHGAPSG